MASLYALPEEHHSLCRRRQKIARPQNTVSVIRHGIGWLRRLSLKGRLWSRVWLLPEPWPQPKDNLEVTHHAPS